MSAIETWPSRVEHQVVLGHALGDWIRRGADVAVIPARLLGRRPLDQLHALAVLFEVCGSVDGADWDVEDDMALFHVCLLPRGHGDVCPWLDNHSWLDMQRDAFVEQMDPASRVARRVAHAAGMKVGVMAYVEVT